MKETATDSPHPAVLNIPEPPGRGTTLDSRLTAVSRVAWQIGLASNLDSAIQAIADNAKSMTAADSCNIYLERVGDHDRRFELAASSPEEKYPREPRFSGGLTETILRQNAPLLICDAQEWNLPPQETIPEVRVKDEILAADIRSIAGVPIAAPAHRAIGVIYVNAKDRGHFNDDDIQVLQALANLIPIAQGLPQPLVSLMEEAEKAADKMFELEAIARTICGAIEERFPFDFVALQVVDRTDESVSTVYGTGVAAGWANLANHRLDKGVASDIQSDIATAKPPRIEIITGNDPRFDRIIFERFEHHRMSRVWGPILVLTTLAGEPIPWWEQPDVWEGTFLESETHATITFDERIAKSRYGDYCIEIIGTIEAGYERAQSISRETAIDLVAFVSQAAVCRPQTSALSKEAIEHYPLREVLLPHALEVITRNAMKIVGGNIAHLAFGRDADGAYVYEFHASDGLPHARDRMKPRVNGLGSRALAAGQSIVEPDINRGHTFDWLKESHPQAWDLGIRAMAAFPMFVEQRDPRSQGVLYVGLKSRYWFRGNEIASVERFVARAVDAIRKSRMFRQRIDNLRRLETFHRVARSLIDDPQKGTALDWVVGSARNTLRAHRVMIFEYYQESGAILPPRVAVGGAVDPDAVGYHPQSEWQALSRWALSQTAEIFEERFSPPSDQPEIASDFPRAGKLFVARDDIKYLAGINLKIAAGSGTELVGTMVVCFQDDRRLNDNDLKALRGLSYGAAVAIGGKRYLESIESSLANREKVLQALRRVDREIVNTKGDARSIQQQVLDAAREITKAESGVFWVSDDRGERFKAVADTGYQRDAGEHTPVVGDGDITPIALCGGPQVIVDASLSEWQRLRTAFAPRARSLLVFPIAESGSPDDPKRVVAAMTLEHPDSGVFRDEQANLLEMLAEQTLIGMHYGELLGSNQKTIRALETLGLIAARAKGVPLQAYTPDDSLPRDQAAGANSRTPGLVRGDEKLRFDRDTIIGLFLTGVTAYEGLRFSRGMVFLRNRNSGALEGAMAIGHSEEDQTKLVWEAIEKEREDIGKGSNELLELYLDRVERLSKAEAVPMAAAVKNQRIEIGGQGGALQRCLAERVGVVVGPAEEDPFRDVLSAVTGGLDRGSAFACVPISFRNRDLGVLVVDNRYQPGEAATNFDLGVLRTYADILAISLEYEALQENAWLSEVFARLGHDLQSPISALSSRMSAFKHTVDRARRNSPSQAEWWTPPLGDSYEKMLDAFEHVKRFAMDLREFGRPVSPKLKAQDLRHILRAQVETFQSDCVIRIRYQQCAETLMMDIDEELLARAINALLTNAQQAILESPGHGQRAAKAAEIRVSAERTGDSGNVAFALLTVCDSGPGVPAERKESIFDAFYTTRRDMHGTGLGLATARRYIQEHRGSIREVGIFGEGARFEISLPVR